MGTVSGKVTHLLSTDAEVKSQTAKVILAQGMGIPIVTEDFLEACKKAKKMVASTKYEIGSPSSSSSSSPAKIKTAKGKQAVATGPEVHPKALLAYSDSAVYIDENDNVYDAELNQQDSSTNTDKFYVMQLLKVDDSSFCLFQLWGRTGTTGSTLSPLMPFTSSVTSLTYALS